MQHILNPSEYSFNLGNNYSRIIDEKFALNGRYRRAWWINPGFVWNQWQMQNANMHRYTVSQRIALILLVGLDEHDGTRRRAILTSSVEIPSISEQTSSTTSSTFSFNVQQSAVVAAVLRVPEEVVSTWRVTLRLTRTQACRKQSVFNVFIHDLLTGAWRRSMRDPETARTVRTVHVMTTAVDKGAEDCPARRDLSGQGEEFSATATATLDIALVFASIDDMQFNLAKFLSFPAVVDMRTLGASRAVITLDPTYVPPAAGGAPSVAATDNASASASASTVIMIIAVIGASVMAWTLIAVIVQQRRFRAAESAPLPN
ncbi:hypothetical protein T484DRAFT_1782743 [Baffinella frigidus]|nr:hypothetical protein T484DRAFT_1782743 [Cryptophyta sp. CCMP2293]